MVSAVVPVGESKRLQEKHFLSIDSRTIVDFLGERIVESKLFKKIYFYSTKKIVFEWGETIFDNEKKGVLYVLTKSINIIDDDIFFIGADMPFFDKASAKKIIEKFNDKSIIPKWKNGYIEPLFSLYHRSIKSFGVLNGSLTEFLNRIDKEFINAHDLNPLTFFNINTVVDYRIAKNIWKDIKLRR